MRLYVGRDNIRTFLGGISWRTVQRKIKRGLPVLQEEGEQPSLLDAHFEQWQRDQIKKKAREVRLSTPWCAFVQPPVCNILKRGSFLWRVIVFVYPPRFDKPNEVLKYGI